MAFNITHIFSRSYTVLKEISGLFGDGVHIFYLYSFCLEYNNTWPVIYKSGEKQMANLLWYNEGLFVDLPHGYVDDLTQVYDSSGTIKADYF